jgi:RNAse (barnase) inhibitor barstar
MNERPSLVIDVSSVQTRDELHELLADQLGFPDYYGKNWDAFDECIRDFPPSRILQIVGFLSLENALPREAAMLRNCLEVFEAELPDSRKVVIK